MIPVGDGPYVRAKQVQLLDRDPDRAVALFWAAINAGDRVDSALKDMALVMKQQNRPEEAIEAIRSFRHRCSEQAQESLDNILLDLYKRCGRVDEQISLIKHKLNRVHQGLAFNGKRTKTARSQGKKFQMSTQQEITRLLGNLGWAYMQQSNYIAADAVYRKALSMDLDNNKLCNLGICLLKQDRFDEAEIVLRSVTPIRPDGRINSECNQLKSYERAVELLEELEAQTCRNTVSTRKIPSLPSVKMTSSVQEFNLWSHWKLWEPPNHLERSISEASDSSGGEVDEVVEKWNSFPMNESAKATNTIWSESNQLPAESNGLSSSGTSKEGFSERYNSYITQPNAYQQSLSVSSHGADLDHFSSDEGSSVVSTDMDFTCVDSVIECIVPDAPPASKAVEQGLQVDPAYQPALKVLSELETIRQHRVRVFQGVSIQR